MTTELQRFSLRLQLQRLGLPLSFVEHTVKDLRDVLRIIEESRTGQSAHDSWSVDTNEIQITASVNGVSTEELQDIISDAYEGFKAVEQQESDWPPGLVDEAQKKITRIINRVKRTAEAHLDAEGHDTLYIEPAPQTSRGHPREQYSAWSSIDGMLDVISVRRIPYFVIFEHVTTYRVRCLFPEDFLPQVKNYLGLRVVAEGFVHYRSDGRPARLTNPTSLERVPDPAQEDITFYRGTMPGITGVLSSYEYVRQMRGAENG